MRILSFALCAVPFVMALACGPVDAAGDDDEAPNGTSTSGGGGGTSTPGGGGGTSTSGGGGGTSTSGGASTSGGGGSTPVDAGPDAALPDRCASPPCADGERCKDNADCTSAVCTNRTCLAASSKDGVKNGTETDTDCGGDPSGAVRCSVDRTCLAGSDCESLSCPAGTCVAPTSGDGIKNGSETDQDCGGGAPTNAVRCAVGKACGSTADCDNVQCLGGQCVPASGSDGLKNGAETDTDCGGLPTSAAVRCPTGKACVGTSDCNAVLCTDAVCASPSASDGIQNGSETDEDCGGGAPTNARRCDPAETCALTSDCNAVLCTGGACQPPGPHDGIQNGTETDVDCGGADAGTDRCPVNAGCNAKADCSLSDCVSHVCKETHGDGYKNYGETDVDCGGVTGAARCAVDKTCGTHTDCASNGCAVSGPKAGKCATNASCVNDLGGYTCGKGDSEFFAGGTNAYESCCATAPIANSAAKLGRFSITAGRMRAFIDRVGGNVRSYVQAAATKPAGWNAAWDVLVPGSVDEANTMLGPYWNDAPNDPNTSNEKPNSKRSCGYGNSNGHTYWIPGHDAEQIYTKAQLDPKALNCVGWHLVKAFCAWDGGRLADANELKNAYTNGYTTSYPWEWTNHDAFNSNVQDQRLNHRWIYGFPNNHPANNRVTWWISPPGRFYRGWNANKVEIAGNLLEWVSNSEYGFVWNYSWEEHTGNIDYDSYWRQGDRDDVPNGYYALGARCAYD